MSLRTPIGPTLDIDPIANRLEAMASHGRVVTVAVTGSVAAGKSTLVAALKSRLGVTRRVETVSTDGYLFSNATLSALGLTLRKGFPESYDTKALLKMLEGVEKGPVDIPGYSHCTYDIDPALSQTINPPDILIVEGLGLAPQNELPGVLGHFDIVIYLEAAEDDLETWFVARFLALRDAARCDSSSFYTRFIGLTLGEAADFAKAVWQEINLPNLRQHISKARPFADLVIFKDGTHSLSLTEQTTLRRPNGEA